MTDCFDTFSLSQPILRALAREGYTKPTPVQQAAIPPLLSGKDLLACAQTGTGKTAAFSLPLLEILSRSRANGSPRALILTPTRELAQQIGESIERYGRYLKLHSAILVGGVAQGPQVQALRRRPEIIVATPGRLLDLLNQGYVKLSAVEFFVLDEADRMLDMGFLPDVRRVLGALSPKRQTMLFSATMPKEIAALAAQMLNNPESVSVAPPASVAENIEQKVLFVRQERKNDALSSVLKDKTISRALVFTRTKHRADRIARLLLKNGVSTDAIHSNKSQSARKRALSAFTRGSVRVLVATDIVSRGIDVSNISHVINYELPHDAESYVHRIGRTARAGASGTALSLCAAEEVSLLHNIERLTHCALLPMTHDFHCAETAKLAELPRAAQRMTQPNRRQKSGLARRNNSSSRRKTNSPAKWNVRQHSN